MNDRPTSSIGSLITRTVGAALIASLVIGLIAVPATGHGIFKKTLEKKYKEEGLRVTCNMCHVRGEPKTERNEVGQVFHKELEEKDLSARWNNLKEDRDERKKLEDEVMAPAFLKALDKIYEREEKGEVETNFSEQIPAGEVEGTRLRKRR